MIHISNFAGQHIEQYQIDSQRPTLIFLHDSLGCVALWRHFPKLLADKLQCNYLVYDRIGYGKSEPMVSSERNQYYLHHEAHALHQIIEAYDIKKPIIFGHSDGATIALLYAALYPKTPNAIIVEAAHVFVEAITLDGVKAAKHQFQTTNIKERLQKYHGDKVTTLVSAWIDTWLDPTFEDWDITDTLSNIICPTLYIQGTNDEFGTIAQVEKTLEKVKGPKLSLIIPNDGHSPHKTSTNVVIDAVVAFYEEFIVPM